MAKRNGEKSDTWLLKNVPKDIQDLIADQQERKKNECGCRYGRGQALFNLLRRACKEEISKLQNAS